MPNKANNLVSFEGYLYRYFVTPLVFATFVNSISKAKQQSKTMKL